ncbi:MAG: hypothetical protein PVF85_10920 [Anaerolineales bacterium]
MKLIPKTATLIFITVMTLSACGQADVDVTATEAAASTGTASVLQATLARVETQIASAQPTQTPIPVETETPEPSVTPSATATAVPAVISVSENTNCRSGPDSTFAFLGVLSVGEQTEIVARSEIPDYWYVVNPDDPASFCWLWGAFATIQGDVDNLPVMTPEPTPTPYAGFDVWFHGFEPCAGSQTAIFAIRNAGASRLWSGYVGVYALNPLDALYGPVKERHPFADRPLPACPPGHGNELYPGEVRYIHTPLSSVPHGRDAYAEITLCNADHAGGDCVTKLGYFYIP